MGLDKQQQTSPVKWVVKNQSRISFEHQIQRKEVWSRLQKSLFIQSLIIGFPINPLYALDSHDGILYMLDGKQRLTSVIQFVNGEFAIHESVADVPVEINGKREMVKIAGKTFEQLPKEAQEEIRDYSLNIYKFKDISDDEIEEFFYRLNRLGTPLNQMETTRVVVGAEARKFIAEITQKPFFTETANLSGSSVNRFVDQEIVLQILKLFMAKCQPTDFGGKELEAFGKTLKPNGIPQDIQEQILKTVDYLHEALPVKQDFIKKLNIPMLFATALKAQEMKIEPVKFGGWVQSFFAKLVDAKGKSIPDNEYNIACKASSARMHNVDKRLMLMLGDFEDNIETAPDYKKPEVKVASEGTGKRGGGRPSNKNKAEEKKSEGTEGTPEGTESKPEDAPALTEGSEDAPTPEGEDAPEETKEVAISPRQ